MMREMAMESCCSEMAGGIRALGKMGSTMMKVSLLRQMEIFIRVNIRMARKMARGVMC
jgi:hypothetical protein